MDVSVPARDVTQSHHCLKVHTYTLGWGRGEAWGLGQGQGRVSVFFCCFFGASHSLRTTVTSLSSCVLPRLPYIVVVHMCCCVCHSAVVLSLPRLATTSHGCSSVRSDKTTSVTRTLLLTVGQPHTTLPHVMCTDWVTYWVGCE